MQNLSGDFLIELNRKFQKAKYLSKEESKRDPVKEPYKSKYEAKNLLIEIIDEIDNKTYVNHDFFSKRELIKALIHFEIGLINIDTEEISLGEQNFKSCIEIIEKNVLEPKCIILALNVYNQYGIIWSQRGEPSKAHDCLKRAESIYCDYKRNNEKISPLNLDEIIYCETDSSSQSDGWENLENAYTYTLYYLGQVYQHLKELNLAAVYLHFTLKRQLNQPSFEPYEWSSNCATLSQYFTQKNEFKIARHYLACSTYILQKHQNLICSENSTHLNNYPQYWADLARCWIKYCISLMTTSKEKISNKDFKDQQNSFTFELESEMPFIMMEKCEPSQILSNHQVAEVEEKISSELVHSYGEAKLIFLRGQEWVNDAKNFYTLDDYASDYITIIQDYSKLFQLLAFFEPNIKNKCKMHKRRIDMLETTLFALNPQYYLSVCRQLMLELAEIYSEMMDLKLAIMDQENARTAHSVQKVNMLIAKAIKYFEKFIESYKSQASKQLPKTLPEEDAHPLLISYFYLGRLYTKFITTNIESKVNNLKSGQSCFQFILDYISSNPDQENIIQDEYKIAKEMNELLPGKIQAALSNVSL